MGVSDFADWWDAQMRETEEILGEWVVENPQWWAIGGATAVQTSMVLGQGLVDVLRLGQCAAQGGVSGYGKDALRLLVVAGPLAKAGGMLSRAVTPLMRSGNLRLAVQVNGVTGPCTFQAVNNALSVTRRQNLLLTVADMAKAVGKPLSTVAKSGNAYQIASFVDELIPAIRAIGARVREVKGLKEIDDVVRLARRETGPVIFAFSTTVKNAAGATTEILHSVIAFRTPGGAVRFADYGGKFVDTLDHLIVNLGRGAPISKVRLLQDGVSAAVVDGALFTGEWASKLAKGAVLVLEGLVAIETHENGVEIAIPVSKAAVREKALEQSAASSPSVSVPPEGVLQGSFELYRQRKRGGAASKLPSNATAAGKHVAPQADWLTGVQFRLNALGFGSGRVDGIMGPVTSAAVRRFQRAHPQLVEDSIPGPKTQAALVEACGY
jgi:hypothetical protein